MSTISWDALFKKIFLRFFQRWQLLVITEHEVSHQAQKIDAVVLCPTEAHRKRLAETAFYFFKHHNLIEFKSTTIEEKYYPLLLFAAGKKREEVLQAFVARGEMEYIQIALILYPETMRRIYTMPKGDYPTIEENLNVLIDWFGIDAITKTYLKSHRPDGLIEAIIRQMDKNQARQLIQSVLDELEKGD